MADVNPAQVQPIQAQPTATVDAFTNSRTYFSFSIVATGNGEFAPIEPAPLDSVATCPCENNS